MKLSQASNTRAESLGEPTPRPSLFSNASSLTVSSQRRSHMPTPKRNRLLRSGSETSAKETHDYDIKILVIGDSKAFYFKPLQAVFPSNSSAFVKILGFDVGSKNLQINDKCVKLNVWSSCNFEHFCRVTAAYYRGARVVILTVNLHDERSYSFATNMVRNAKKYLGENTELTTFCVLGLYEDNKQIQVSAEKLQKFAGENRFLCYTVELNDHSAFLNVFKESAKQALEICRHPLQLPTRQGDDRRSRLRRSGDQIIDGFGNVVGEYTDTDGEDEGLDEQDRLARRRCSGEFFSFG